LRSKNPRLAGGQARIFVIGAGFEIRARSELYIFYNIDRIFNTFDSV
jgi:hypothetical protein